MTEVAHDWAGPELQMMTGRMGMVNGTYSASQFTNAAVHTDAIHLQQTINSHKFHQT